MIPEVNVVIGQRMRKARIKLNMPGREMAVKLGITPQQIYKYENGENNIPNHKISTICKFLDISPDELFGWKKKEKTPYLMILYTDLPAKRQRIINALIRMLSE